MNRGDTAGGHTADLGKLVLRLLLGGIILFHGISKVISGPAMITGLVAKAGLPQEFGYLVYVGEVLAPLMLIFGVWTRLAALIIMVNMIVAVWLVHMGQIFTLNETGGWALELQGMFFGTALAILLLGAGRYSLTGSSGRLN
ncbi:DoxX family protein [Noviherbaspirillum massiliense]|uniref:DoxX family protein n=1 Tax=Noviherbaspirillum massiliense TaxID=1465823 RepID=UPI00030BB150|nr:DoxX family protein [Noviherbaspirillum massiliense]